MQSAREMLQKTLRFSLLIAGRFRQGRPEQSGTCKVQKILNLRACEQSQSAPMTPPIARYSLLIALTATFAGATAQQGSTAQPGPPTQPAQPGQPALPAQLTLSEALRIALANNTSIREAQARLDQSTGRYGQYRGELLPQVGIGARQGYQTVNLIGIGIPITPRVLGPFGSFDARVFFSQELLNISKIRSWQSSRSREDSSRLFVDNARELVALNVVVTYLQGLRAKASRDTLTAQTKLAEELHKLTRERVNQGVAAELDANRAEQQVHSLDQQRLEAEQSYVEAKLALANILHARITSDFEIVDEKAYGSGEPPDRDASVKAALAARADYRALEASVKAAQLQVRSIKAYRLPSLRLAFDDGQSGRSPVENNNVYRLSGILEIPIFTGGRIRGQIDEAEGSLREAMAALDQNRSQIETDVLTAISGVEWALKEVATSTGNMKLSRQEVELTRARYSQGVADNTEVVNAQDRLSRADDSAIRALYTLGLARANLARATGAASNTYSK